MFQGVRGLASPDPVLDAYWWSGAGLPDLIEAIRSCSVSGVGLVAQFDVHNELWKSGVGVWH